MTGTRAGAAAFAVVMLAALVGCERHERGPQAPEQAPAAVAEGTCLIQNSASPTPSGSGLPSGPGASLDPLANSVESSGPQLPDLALSCLNGSGTVQLGQITGPAVINLWASWCAPCRNELPALQRYSQRATGKVLVVGVDSGDPREDGASLAADLHLSFPNLYDTGSQLRNALGAASLPFTVFLDGHGRVVYEHRATALDEQKLQALVEEHLGVVVPE